MDNTEKKGSSYKPIQLKNQELTYTSAGRNHKKTFNSDGFQELPTILLKM